ALEQDPGKARYIRSRLYLAARCCPCAFAVRLSLVRATRCVPTKPLALRRAQETRNFLRSSIRRRSEIAFPDLKTWRRHRARALGRLRFGLRLIEAKECRARRL